MKTRFFLSISTTAILMLVLSACSFEHRWDEANARDGTGYPTDYRIWTWYSKNQPLNGLHFPSEAMPVSQKTMPPKKASAHKSEH